MDARENIKKDFEILKQQIFCIMCHNIPIEPYFIQTCCHYICKLCIDHNKLYCISCNKKFCSDNLKPDVFIAPLISELTRINKIFQSPSTADNDAISQVLKQKTILKRNHRGETQLHLACKTKNLEKVQKLVDSGVDLNGKDYAGWVALHEAVVCNNLAIVTTLLNAGALINVSGEFYLTPLHKAVSLGYKAIEKLLLQYGADINAYDYCGKTPLDYAEKSPELIDILKGTKRVYRIIPNIWIKSEKVLYFSNNKKTNIDLAFAKVATQQEFLQKDVTTHLIIGLNESESFNILVAMLKGLCIVREDWIDSYSADEQNVLVSDYQPERFQKKFEEAQLNAMLKRPNLFDGIYFYFVGDAKSYKIDEIEINRSSLTVLVGIGGGNILKREPALRTAENFCRYPYHAQKQVNSATCCHYIIYKETEPPLLLYNMKELKHKSSRWLIDCILNFSILP